MKYLDFSDLSLDCTAITTETLNQVEVLGGDSLKQSCSKMTTADDHMDEFLDSDSEESENKPFVFSETLKQKLSEDLVSMVLKRSASSGPPPSPPKSWAIVPYISPDERLPAAIDYNNGPQEKS